MHAVICAISSSSYWDCHVSDTLRAQDSLSVQLSDAVEALQTCKEDWNSKESKLLSEAKEANKKHQQLADRTALVRHVLSLLQIHHAQAAPFHLHCSTCMQSFSSS